MMSIEPYGDESACTKWFQALSFPGSFMLATRHLKPSPKGWVARCKENTCSAICGVSSVQPLTTQTISQLHPRELNSLKMLCRRSDSSVATITLSSFQAKMPMETCDPSPSQA